MILGKMAEKNHKYTLVIWFRFITFDHYVALWPNWLCLPAASVSVCLHESWTSDWVDVCVCHTLQIGILF